MTPKDNLRRKKVTFRYVEMLFKFLLDALWNDFTMCWMSPALFAVLETDAMRK